MIVNRIVPDNEVAIVDLAEFVRLEASAKRNDERIQQMARQMFINESKKNGINIVLQINDVEEVLRYNEVITEQNNSERTCPYTISEELKYRVVDDITKHINAHFAYYQDDVRALVFEKSTRMRKRIETLNYTVWVLSVLLFASVVLVLFSLMKI